MIRADGPRGARLYIEPDHALPLLWTTVAVRGGAAADPVGEEGLARHAAELARRGAGHRDRQQIDAALDDIGASFDPGVTRDAVSFSGLTLSRHIDRAASLWAEILARPRFSEDEHQRLVRETLSSLDDIRDDDALVAQRAFDRQWAPGHPYARTARGTESSLAKLTATAARALFEREVVPANLVIGFAGDIDEPRARELAASLTENLPDRPAPALRDVSAPPRVRGRRIIVVDKPARSKTQIYVGHPAPPYGTEDAARLAVVETAFGGMFSSRLMQEIRVKRGWSYGASCRIAHARGPSWLRMSLAPASEVAAEALALTFALYEDVAQNGITAEELALAKSYLAGSLPFSLATPQSRLHVAVSEDIFGLAPGYIHREAEILAQTTLEDARRVAQTYLFPGDAVAVVVATAEKLAPALERAGLAPTAIIPYDTI